MSELKELVAGLIRGERSFEEVSQALQRYVASTPGGGPEPYAGVKSDLVIFDLAGLPGAGERPHGRFPPLGNAVAPDNTTSSSALEESR